MARAGTPLPGTPLLPPGNGNGAAVIAAPSPLFVSANTRNFRAQLRQDNNLSHHSQFIVQHAYVRVNARLGEGHAEARRAQRGLCQTGTILGWLGNKS